MLLSPDRRLLILPPPGRGYGVGRCGLLSPLYDLKLDGIFLGDDPEGTDRDECDEAGESDEICGKDVLRCCDGPASALTDCG